MSFFTRPLRAYWRTFVVKSRRTATFPQTDGDARVSSFRSLLSLCTLLANVLAPTDCPPFFAVVQTCRRRARVSAIQ